MTVNRNAAGTGIEWKALLRTVRIDIGTTEFEFMCGEQEKCVYVMQRDPNNQTIITVYDSKGTKKDSRTYSHYFHKFLFEDNYVWMAYYSWTEQAYFQGKFIGDAGITGVKAYTGT